ncbi:unnamed protein product [Dicrocoelium dendriticum]|nr:unnamed protein product [Dicrocoelium dendriticum]
MDSRLEELIYSTESLAILPDKKRVKCLYTMHEMPYNFEIISQYLTCNKYRRAQANRLIEDHSEYIVDAGGNRLFCKLTWRYINRDPDQLLLHFKGRRFQQALLRYNKCKESGEEYVPVSGKFKCASYFKESCTYRESDCPDEATSGAASTRHNADGPPPKKVKRK